MVVHHEVTHKITLCVLIYSLAWCYVLAVDNTPVISTNSSTNKHGDIFICFTTGTRGVILCDPTASGTLKEYENPDEMVDPQGTPIWWGDLAIVSGLVIWAGLMSGLTIGLVGLDMTSLEILSKSGTPKQRSYAKRILPLLKRHHLLLVTLLIMNAVAMETLPIFLERLVPPIAAIVLSVTLILMFGEIIPQAICNRYGLAIGANMAYIVWGLIGVCFVLAWPLSKLLDLVIGKDHGTHFKRAELKELVQMHGKAGEETLTIDEITIIRGALDLRNKTVAHFCTPLRDVYMLNIKSIMTKDLMEKIVKKGHSRIPVYRDSRDHLVGALLVKNLILVPPLEELPIASLKLTRLPLVSANTQLYHMLNIFQTGKCHMAAVVDENDNWTPIGIITLEDVIEELIQEEIEDEKDALVRLSNDASNSRVSVQDSGLVKLNFDDDSAEEDNEVTSNLLDNNN